MTTAVFDNESFNESLNETQSSQQLTDLHRANLHLSNAHLDALEGLAATEYFPGKDRRH